MSHVERKSRLSPMAAMVLGAARGAGRARACVLIALLVPVVVDASGSLPAGSTPQQRSEQITWMISSATCEDDAQCRVIGIGARACGGPQFYAAWSVAHTDPAALQQLVDLDAQAQRKELETKNIESPCVVLPVPGVRCDRHGEAGGGRGHCMLQDGRTGNATLR